jgi:vitamin B12 transporter
MSDRPIARRAVIVLVLLTAATATAAPPLFVDEIVVTATGDECPPEEVPIPITVVGRDEMDDIQADTLADVLRRVPGINVARSGGEGGVTSVFTRGTESDHTLVMVDGIRLNSPYFAGYDFSLLPTAGLERVEVARGPFSALWGADAVGGVVNVIPARAEEGLGGGVAVEGGGDSWQRLEGSLTWGSGPLHAFVSGFTRSGEEALPNSDYELRQALADVGWSWGHGSRAAILVQRLESVTGIPYAAPGSPSPERRQWSDQTVLAVPLSIGVTPGWELEVSAASVDRRFRFRDPDDPYGYTHAVTDADSVQGRLVSHHELDGHALSWGGEWREDTVTDVSSFGTSLDETSQTVHSVFVQDVWQPAAGLQIVAGLRRDTTDTWGSELSPRINLGWRVADRVEIRAGAGEAFRQPSLGELYYPGSGNTDLEPERARSWELGVSGWWQRRAGRWQLAVFSTDVEDLVEFDSATYAFANIAEATIHGGEASVELPLARRLLASAEVTYLETADDAGRPLPRRPGWSGSISFTGSVGSHLSGDLSLRWVGPRQDVDPLSLLRVTNAGFVTADVALAVAVGSGLELTGRVVNLADRRYAEVLGYPAPGRRVVGGLRWRP